MSAPAILALALILDAALGEPDWLWRRLPHPAVVMGRAIARAEARLNRGDRRRAKGAAFVTVTAAALAAAGLVPGLLPGGWVLEVIVAAMLLAQRSLADHVAAVAAALDQGLPQARRSVGQIVGRQTATLDRPGVARAAIESAAENLSDGVVAPAFWFLVAGLPGLILYKFVNTADSMIGHLSDRYRAFGWAAARLDDVLNLVPARLTAGLIALAAAIPARFAWPCATRGCTGRRTQAGPRLRWPRRWVSRWGGRGATRKGSSRCRG